MLSMILAFIIKFFNSLYRKRKAKLHREYPLLER